MQQSGHAETKDNLIGGQAMAPILIHDSKKEFGKLQHTGLNETPLNQAAQGLSGGSSTDDEMGKSDELEIRRRGDKSIIKIQNERIQLQDELNRLKEEMLLLKHERVKEEQRRLIRESGVPKVNKSCFLIFNL